MKIEESLLITHQNCMDGSGVAVLFLAAGGKIENIRFSPPDNNKMDDLFEKSFDSHIGPIIVADISVSKRVAQKFSGVENIVLLDHHKTASDIKNVDWCEIDLTNTRCGTKMLYDWLVNNRHYGEDAKVLSYKEFVDTVNDYDLWKKKIPFSETLATLHYGIGQMPFIERFVKNSSVDLTNEEEFLLKVLSRKKEDYVRDRVTTAKFFTKDLFGTSYKIAFVVASDYHNNIATSLKDKADVVAIANANKISLRKSDDCDLDLSDIAKRNGGGGHVAASGYPVASVLGKSFCSLIFEEMEW